MVNAQQSLEQWSEKIQAKGICPVGLRVGWVVVNLEEKPVNAGRDGTTREQRNELRLAAGDSVGRRRHLYRVGAVEDNWSEAGA